MPRRAPGELERCEAHDRGSGPRLPALPLRPRPLGEGVRSLEDATEPARDGALDEAREPTPDVGREGGRARSTEGERDVGRDLGRSPGFNLRSSSSLRSCACRRSAFWRSAFSSLAALSSSRLYLESASRLSSLSDFTSAWRRETWPLSRLASITSPACAPCAPGACRTRNSALSWSTSRRAARSPSLSSEFCRCNAEACSASGAAAACEEEADGAEACCRCACSDRALCDSANSARRRPTILRRVSSSLLSSSGRGSG
mmetsp:Transcript_21761/g.56784  ORF Transcript_21761/g.56784 Transcript_21761/m.56784 type:complete len:259 (+) Transcript_21761:673-1449(+)